MNNNIDAIEQKNIVSVMRKSFIDYSMSVIVARALPDLRDGLKPVHRRILYTMYEDGLTPDKAFRKSATTVGAVLGKYHPHGDTSVYDAMVRMAQDFSYRYCLVDGHGNFGSIDGFSAAAYRYTEARLSKLSLELLRDIKKKTIDFTPNFDDTTDEPTVLPSRFPNILVNGTMGIAVGMATNIPPHNLGEVIDGCVAYIDNPEISVMDLMQYIKGPDFPTGGNILGNNGIKKAYETGRGSITIRATANIVEENNKNKIVITDIPYQVNKTALKTRIAELVRDKIIEGISDLQDESSLKDGIKMVIHLKKEANANVVLNNLYKYTQLQTNFGIILLMLDDQQPKTLNLYEIISKYIDFQKSVIYRRTKYDCEKAEEKVHILEGLKIALDNIDNVIKIIKESKSDEEAKEKLGSSYGLDDEQVTAILEMKLRRLTGLERDKIEAELNELLALIQNLREILADEKKVMDIIKEELLEIKSKYADERRTNIDMTAIEYIEDESLIPEENIMVALTNKGYIKRFTSDAVKSQNRGGVGVKGMATNEEDYVDHLINLSTHDYILFFSNKGKVYRLKGYEVPEFGRTAKGIPVVNLLQIEKEEYIKSIIKVSPNEDTKCLLFVTKNGLIKKTALSEFESIRTNGKICITLKDNDELIAVKKTSGEDSVLLGSNTGRMVKFNENETRMMGRSASGVKGIELDGGECIGAEIASDDDTILIVTLNGYGKKTNVRDFRETKRGSKGVKALSITDKNGPIAAFKVVDGDQDVIIITDSGVVMRMPLEQISTLGRVTQGVRLIHLKGDQKVSTISLVDKKNDDQSNDENTDSELENIQNTDDSIESAQKEENNE